METWGEATPDAPAVDEYGAVWTYGELRGRMRRIAALLRGLGVERNDRIAVLMDNGALAYSAILGALAADACFVPLNPAFPALRLGDIVDAGRTGRRHHPDAASAAALRSAGACACATP